MLELFVAEVRMKREAEQLQGVTRRAWKWFGRRTFCETCLAQEQQRLLSID